MEEEKKGVKDRVTEDAEGAAKLEEKVKEHFGEVVAKNEKKMENEKTFEGEVKEHFVEVIADNEKKMEKENKKKRKRLKPWQIVLIVIAAVILAAGLGVGGYLLVKTLTFKEYVPVEVELESARPNVASTFSEAEQATIDLALQDNATEDQIKEALALLYTKANQNKIAAQSAITVARGSGTATVGIPIMGKVKDVNGSMVVRAFKVQSGDAFYYQKGAKVVNCSVKSVVDIVSGILNQQERTYESGTGVYKTVCLKGKEAKVSDKETATVPYFALGDPSSSKSCADRDEFLEKGYYLEDPREICNFRITKDTIVLKPLAEGEKYIKVVTDENGQKYYETHFSLLIEGEGHDECVQIARQYLRDSSDSEDLEYGKYDLQFEVWDNGYAKFFHDDEIWQGDFEILGAKSTTASDSWYECTFYYDFIASLFTEADAAKYKGDDWAKKVIDDYATPLK